MIVALTFVEISEFLMLEADTPVVTLEELASIFTLELVDTEEFLMVAPPAFNPVFTLDPFLAVTLPLVSFVIIALLILAVGIFMPVFILELSVAVKSPLTVLVMIAFCTVAPAPLLGGRARTKLQMENKTKRDNTLNIKFPFFCVYQ